VRRPLTVAVTGSIGAGKSEVLRAFGRRGVPVQSSDEVVHRLIASDPEVRAALEERFGTTERARIAEVVFADSNELAWLEALLHPRVRREHEVWVSGLDGAPVCVAEVPLLFESGSEARFDRVVVVTAPEETRAARSKVDLARRSSRLMPDDEKVHRADYVFVNDGSLEEVDRFVERVLEELR